MASLFQSIEILSKEKGIDSQIVVDALKDAMLAAARKQYRNQELVVDLDEASGNIVVYALRTVVEAVSDPSREITLTRRPSDPLAQRHSRLVEPQLKGCSRSI